MKYLTAAVIFGVCIIATFVVTLAYPPPPDWKQPGGK